MKQRGVRRFRRLGWVCAGALSWPVQAALPQPLLAPLPGAASEPATAWRWVGVPGQKMPRTEFAIQWLEGGPALRVSANGAYGNLVHALPPGSPGRTLSWHWRVERPVAGADLARKASDDVPLKVCAMFDLPASAVPFVERLLMRIARAATGTALPAATVCYVWDQRLAAGTVLDNAYTRRVRQIVLRGAESPLHEWQAESRDVHADFLRLFGDEARELPPWLGVAVGADADNTAGHSLAYLRELVLH